LLSTYNGIRQAGRQFTETKRNFARMFVKMSADTVNSVVLIKCTVHVTSHVIYTLHRRPLHQNN